MNVQPTHNIEEHNYDSGANLFARTVGHEKLSIISPAIRGLFKELAQNDQISQGGVNILDIGCGPFVLSIPFLRDGHHVDGVDTSEKMLAVAKKTLEASKKKLPDIAPLDRVKLVGNIDLIDDASYDVAMMNFMHQCAPNRVELNKIFQKAAEKIKPNGHLILTGAHPEFLHFAHACCEYDVDDSRKLNDGDKYTGRIFNEDGESTYELQGDYFWNIDTVSDSAKSSGFRLSSVSPIKDIETPYRKAKSPAYFIMHLRRSI